jgi:hypothetical protein
MAHVVLLGDSIFDNTHYVPAGWSVVEQLRKVLPTGWRVTLAAVDGAGAEDVRAQLARAPADATHFAVSVGGNNALDYSNLILNESAQAYAEVLSRLAAIRLEFQVEYHAMLEGVLETGKPTLLCTVYDSIPGLDPAEHSGLCLFNDVILREAFAAGLPVIDLRSICRSAADYSSVSPIEPSDRGGGKIAEALARVLATHAILGLGEREFLFNKGSKSEGQCGPANRRPEHDYSPVGGPGNSAVKPRRRASPITLLGEVVVECGGPICPPAALAFPPAYAFRPPVDRHAVARQSPLRLLPRFCRVGGGCLRRRALGLHRRRVRSPGRPILHR